jgi:hypothetical protein
MDPILAALPASLLKLVEGSLSNDEVSSDEEMLGYFIDNGLTEEQARQALTYRDQYLNNIYLDRGGRGASLQSAHPAVRAGLSDFLPPPGAVLAPGGRCCSRSSEDTTMPANTSSTLYRIDECPDVMADACVGDDQGNLIFLSIWARDTAVQQFLARLTLGRDEQGLDQFHVITNQGGSVPVFIGNVDRLEKRITRAYRRTLFGSLSNVWLFDRRCVKPDKANASALALLPRDSAHRLDRLWMLVRDTCPLPLLDHWRETVLELLQTREMLARLPFALGPLEGHRLAIDVPALTLALGSLIRSDVLTAYPYPAKIWTPEAVAA